MGNTAGSQSDHERDDKGDKGEEKARPRSLRTSSQSLHRSASKSPSKLVTSSLGDGSLHRPRSASNVLGGRDAGTSGPTYSLSKSHTRAIQKLWKATHGKGAGFAGAEIFDKVFMKVPSSRQLFESKTHGMRGHYVLFGEALDQVITKLDEPDTVRDFLRELGRRHAAVRSEGFDPKLWNVFGEALIHSALEWDPTIRRNEDIQQAWCNVVLFIVACMREGYYEVLRKTPHPQRTSVPTSKSFLTVDQDAGLESRRYSYH
uniref:Globin family profile domain-containing protein n=1 Tax=Plectus sambesii TaxID=2011161 RepID=A0A914UM07_9BILA